jgi:hypothetical protein
MNGAKTLGRVGGVSGSANAGAVTTATLKDDKEEKVPVLFPKNISLFNFRAALRVNIIFEQIRYFL